MTEAAGREIVRSPVNIHFPDIHLLVMLTLSDDQLSKVRETEIPVLGNQMTMLFEFVTKSGYHSTNKIFPSNILVGAIYLSSGCLTVEKRS